MNIQIQISTISRVCHPPDGPTSSSLVTYDDDPVKWDEMQKVVEQLFSNNSVILLREAEGGILYETSFFKGEEIRDWFLISEEVQSIFYISEDSRSVFIEGHLIDSRTTANEFKYRGNFESVIDGVDGNIQRRLVIFV